MKNNTILKLLGLSFLVTLLATSCRKAIEMPQPPIIQATAASGQLSTDRVVSDGTFVATVSGITTNTKYAIQITDIDQNTLANVKVETIYSDFKHDFAVKLKDGAYDVILIDSKANVIGRTPLIIKN